MKKTTLYKAIHEKKDAKTGKILAPIFGLTYQLNNQSPLANIIFVFPRYHHSVRIIKKMIIKAKELSSSTKAPVDIFLFFEGDKISMISTLDEDSHQLLFSDSNIHLYLLNIKNIQENLLKSFQITQEVNNYMVFMHAYYCDINKHAREKLSLDQLAFLDKDWDDLLINPTLQLSLIKFFMKNSPFF